MYEVFLCGVGTIPNRKFNTVEDAVEFEKHYGVKVYT